MRPQLLLWQRTNQHVQQVEGKLQIAFSRVLEKKFF